MKIKNDLKKIRHSYIRKGTPYDHTGIESFDEANQAFFPYIVGFYNRNRSQNSISYLNPQEIENQEKAKLA